MGYVEFWLSYSMTHRIFSYGFVKDPQVTSEQNHGLNKFSWRPCRNFYEIETLSIIDQTIVVTYTMFTQEMKKSHE